MTVQMPGDNNVTITPPAAPAAPVETPPAAPVVTTPPVQKPATDWEAAYKGLQANYQKLKTSHDQLQAQVDALTAENEGHKQSLVSLQGKLTDAENQVKKTNTVLTRQQLIMSEFGDLAEFEAQGLLPSDGEAETLRTKLTTFREKLKSRVGNAVQSQSSGSSPAATPSTNATPQNNEDEDYVWRMMSETAGSKPQEFLKWRDKYDAIQEAKRKK